jgi:hypothetical protein
MCQIIYQYAASVEGYVKLLMGRPIITTQYHQYMDSKTSYDKCADCYRYVRTNLDIYLIRSTQNVVIIVFLSKLPRRADLRHNGQLSELQPYSSPVQSRFG